VSGPIPDQPPANRAPGWGAFVARSLRRWHLYLGVFFTPMLLFFVLSGWYQVQFPERLKSAGDAETFLQKMRVVHTDQIYPGDTERTRPSSARGFQWMVYTMSAAMVATTLIGVWLAFRTLRRTAPVWVSLVLGIAVPIALLALGRKG